MRENTDIMNYIQNWLATHDNSGLSLEQSRAELQALKRSSGYTIEQSVRRYDVLIDCAVQSVFARLSINELRLVIEVLASGLPVASFMNLLPDEIGDEIQYDHLDEVWGVDGTALLRKLNSFNLVEIAALFEVSDRYAATDDPKAYVAHLVADFEIIHQNNISI